VRKDAPITCTGIDIYRVMHASNVTVALKDIQYRYAGFDPSW